MHGSNLRVPRRRTGRRALLAAATSVLLAAATLPAVVSPATAVTGPSSVTIAGSLQSELGCPGDWQPDCTTSMLTYSADDDVWQGSFPLPAGSFEYKAALDGTWDVSYGSASGANIPLALGAGRTVTFLYSDATHWVADNVTSTIVTAAGSFQSELGCPGDWQPDCLRSWLQDPDGDGVYTFETTSIPAGSYEGKAALDQSWDINYGKDGVQNGQNIAFTVPRDGAKVSFRYVASTHVLTIQAGHGADNNVEWDGLAHDSRDPLYRSPSGAVPQGTAVTLRLRTFAGDVTGAKVRLYSVNDSGQSFLTMKKAASSVSCYDEALAAELCDFWQATIPATHKADNLWYRFIVTDGTDTDYYADDTPALDGGIGAASDEPVDQSWALMIHEPGFTAPSWAKDAVVYQIFPDRFRNGRKDNDPKTGDVRYADPVVKTSWGALPEGYCRNYADASTTTCAWRYGQSPSDTRAIEQPTGRDYAGGDLKGVDQKLDYLKALGVTTVYFNPIFDAGSNHSYDTQDYSRIDPYFGSKKDWENLVKHAKERGIRIVLDGVFNHLSSDSPFFDRYHHYSTVGACESTSSPFRSWFFFQEVGQGNGECAGAGGSTSATYSGWFNFDSIPVIDKAAANSSVWKYFLTGSDAVAKRWLREGAAGWRMDVAGDPSFPAGYWETFRQVVKSTKSSALTIAETWQKDSTLLRGLRGDRFDTTMNYRFRDAVLGFLAPGSFDSKGFADSGRVIAPSEFLNRLASQREDYPDAAYYSTMNLLDSHDTERLLWTLTPGQATRADKEQNSSNVGQGKSRLRLASLIQYTLPGMPTVYYGDEVGMTGGDDPDDRRTYPWADQGGSPDTSLLAHYQSLAKVRRDVPALRSGDFRPLLADDADGVVAFGRATTSQAAITVVNRGATAQTVDVPVSGWVRDGLQFTRRYAVGSGATFAVWSKDGVVRVTVPALGAAVLATSKVDLAPTAAPVASLTDEGSSQLSVSWAPVRGAVSYDVWVSPLTGGGYTKATSSPVTGTSFTLTGLRNGAPAYVVVTATDAAGNVSRRSNEVTGLPHLAIGWSNLQWPPSMTHTLSAVNRTDTAYGQVWIDGVTNQPGATPGLRAELGFGPDGSDPDGSTAWTWVAASFNGDVGSNDEFQASMLPESTGAFDYAFRYSTTDGRDWVYADLDGSGNGYSPSQAGSLTVVSNGDTTAPDVPTGLAVTSASPAGIDLAWDAVQGDTSLYGYEVLRSATSGGPYEQIARVTGTTYTDTAVAEGDTWYYVVRSLDLSFNRSGASSEVVGTAELRTVTLDFVVTVPAGTDGVGTGVHVAGFLDRLDGGLPQWDPGAVALTRVDATHWRISLTGKEGTQLEYKYALGSWDFVEKDAGCGEIANRQLTLSYGSSGVQTVNDTVLNWRNVSPCGN
ncbi:MAG: alpha-amylase family glycosyl hydrolase [Candidatus Nanopelagicales bacterium]